MSDFENMSLEKLLNKLILYIKINDIFYYCDDNDTVFEYIKNIDPDYSNADDVRDFLLKHESKIDKESLIVIAIKNCIENLELLEKELKSIDREIDFYGTEKKLEDFLDAANYKLNLEQDIKEHKKKLKEIKKLGRDISKCIVRFGFNSKINEYSIDVIDAKELIKGKTLDRDENLKRFNKIHENLKIMNDDEHDEEGIEYILQGLVLTDYTEIFSPDAIDIASKMRCVMIDNEILRSTGITCKEIEKLKGERPDKYQEMSKEISKNQEELLSKQKEMLLKYIQYVDIDRLLLLSAYRFEEFLENAPIKGNDVIVLKNLLTEILNNIQDDKKVHEFNIESEIDGEYITHDIVYSADDIKECIRKFSKDTYYSTKKINKIKEDLKSGKKEIVTMPQEEIDICLDENDIDKIAILSDENFIFIAKKFSWQKDKALSEIKLMGKCSNDLLEIMLEEYNIETRDLYDLYMGGILNINQIQSMKYFFDFSEMLTSSELNKLHNEKENDENTLKDYQKYLNLYKEIIVKDKTKDLDEYANNLMAEVVENYDSKDVNEHIQTIEDYYKDGVLTLNSIIEWNDDEVVKKVINDLYNLRAINLDEIKQLVKLNKLPFEFINELILQEDISYEERKQLISEGWMPEDEILKLYSKALIRKEDLEELAEKSIISKRKVQKAIKNTTIETLEENALYIELDIGNLQKISKNESIYDNNGYNTGAKRKNTRIIDPNAREELFDLLHARIIPRKEKGRQGLEINKESPFYNYKFYGIPDEEGKINLDSIIIAERIYEDIETEEKFAVDNATYFFKYGDLLVLSNYTKKGEAIKELENMVFKANHILATEEKNGYWGAGVIYAIAKTMLSSNMKNLTKKQQRIKVIETLESAYKYDEIMDILDKSQEIDLGEHTYDVIFDTEKNTGDDR